MHPFDVGYVESGAPVCVLRSRLWKASRTSQKSLKLEIDSEVAQRAR